MRTTNEKCEIVYANGDDDCLPLSAEPKHSIENWRAFLAIEKVCANRDGKQLIWVNGEGNIYQLDVEAAIATDFFTTPFFNRCPYPCAYTRMCVPDPCDCLQGEWVPLSDDELALNNNLLDIKLQFIYKHVYYDGRESEWSDPSTTYYQSTRGCNTAAGFSRCLKLRIPIGNPLVDKIKIGFTTGNDIWYLTEIVDKYKKYNNTQEKWYERSLAELPGYSDVDCSFDYYFCNDKQKITIDPSEITRVFNPIPRDVQGLINIKDALGFYNYVQGNCPVDKVQLEKFEITTDCSSSIQNCTPKFSTVTVRAVILNRLNHQAGFVFSEGVYGTPDDISKTAYFGSVSHGTSESYGQKFNSPTRNFIAYVEATEFWSEAKQWLAVNGFTGNSETGVVAIEDKGVGPGELIPNIKASMEALKNSGKYYYQEFKIKVPKGTRGFLRLPSHFSTSGGGSSQDTSTNVVGVLNIKYFQNGVPVESITDFDLREIYFDTCMGDVELFDAFLIIDNTANGPNGTAYAGYIKDEKNNPVEGADIFYQSPDERVAVTDHNGFYTFSKSGSDNADINVKVEQDCTGGFDTVKSLTIQAYEGSTSNQDLIIDTDDYDEDFFANVVVPVKNCDGNPVPNARVAISGSKYKVSDLNGNANFKVRNYSSRDRNIRPVVMNNNGCFILDCSEQCNPCMPTTTQLLPACFSGTPTVTTSNLVINTDTIVSEVNGLKSGGRYEFALLVKGDCGRISAAYPIKYLDIPKTQEKGYLGFCNFNYQDLGMTLPSWGKCLQILRSSNLNNYELQWKVDKIESTSDGKKKLTIQSLNDYNTQYGFKTNTTYQWVKGDRIEFIYNGDGTILDTTKNAVLNYLALSPFLDEAITGDSELPADFFNQLLILDDGRLEDITEGAIIELQRHIPATESQIYYSICASIPIQNGSLLYPYGTFSTFDTFLVNRTISGQSGSFIGTFEHHSPSDFWGNKISDAGKRYVANEFENEKRFGRNIAINSPTVANFFDSALVKKFEAPGQGDITAMHIVDGKIIIAICENDNFLAQSADELVRVGGDGIIRALPPDAVVSDAEPKIIGAYGCQYDDIGSIYFGDGYAMFVDSNKKAHVRHDYSLAKDVAIQKASSYFRIRCQEKEKHNSIQSDPLNKYRWSTGLNFQTGEVYLTLKTPRMGSVYNYSKPYQAKNDTIIYHPLVDQYLGFAGFTPEFYSQLDLTDESGCSFICYSNGIPYIHPILSERFNEFFGVTVDSVIGVTLNKFKEKIKRPMAIEIQSTMKWFAAEVTTENPKFVSEIPPAKFKRENGKWSAGFLYNKNSRAGLHGNSKERVAEDTRGRFVNITLIRDNTQDNIYGSIDPAKRVLYDELGEIFIKCAVVEQSAFTENL